MSQTDTQNRPQYFLYMTYRDICHSAACCWQSNWPCMKGDIHWYVKSCPECQLAQTQIQRDVRGRWVDRWHHQTRTGDLRILVSPLRITPQAKGRSWAPEILGEWELNHRQWKGGGKCLIPLVTTTHICHFCAWRSVVFCCFLNRIKFAWLLKSAQSDQSFN